MVRILVVSIQELTQTIEAKIRKNDAWHVCAHENYGAFNIAPDKKLEKLLYCVTISSAVVAYAKKNGYGAIISHHPILNKENFPQLIYHTSLDCAPVFSLNDFWKDFLGVKNAKHIETNLGWTGDIEPISFQNLQDKIETKLEAKMIGEMYNSQSEINSVAICAGLGGAVNNLALKTNADCYILGQNIVESKETGFRNVIEQGHTLSERCGHKTLGKIIKDLPIQFDIVPLKLDHSFTGETAIIN